MIWAAIAGAALAALGGGFWFYRMVMSPELQYHSVWYKLKAKIMFWAGDVRKVGSFPYVTWAAKRHGLSYKEMRDGASMCRAGDIGLHRDDGYLSNLAIPGGFKHAWVCVENGDIVEAVSEGVIRRDALAPLVTDYAVILRPIGVSKGDVNRCVRRAMSIIGSDYDANFNFDFEEAEEALGGEEGRFARNLGSGRFHPAFSCTEVAGYSWFHKRDELRVFRSTYAGREAIIADDYLRMNFGIVWLSRSATAEWAESCGMPEEAVRKISDFWDGKRDFNKHGNPVPRRL